MLWLVSGAVGIYKPRHHTVRGTADAILSPFGIRPKSIGDGGPIGSMCLILLGLLHLITYVVRVYGGQIGYVLFGFHHTAPMFGVAG